jgi:hypothetical protein
MFFTRPKSPQWYYRTGASSPDFQIGGLTADNSYHPMDLSSIVPVGTIKVKIRAQVQATASIKSLSIKATAESDDYNKFLLATQANGVPIAGEGDVELDTDRKCQYKLSTATWSLVYITVAAYYL